jgi:uncharacterized membrane protein YfcA
MAVFFLFILGLVACLYASVGHGGASGYMAVMALFGHAPEAIKSSALTLNVLVSGIAFWQYRKNGHFNWALFWPFAIVSIPFSFVGGLIHIDPSMYKKILGVLLVFPSLRLLGLIGRAKEEIRPLNLPFALAIGAVIGLMSGMIGIGGGIILSPVILALGWGRIKETGGVSALFIFVNSLAGLSANGWGKLGAFSPNDWLSMITVAVFGWLGAMWGSGFSEEKNIKRVLAGVLLFASLKLTFL